MASPAKSPKRDDSPAGKGTGNWDRSLTAEQRRERQRRQITDAATRVMARAGLAQTSVQDVLDASGIARRTFYEHFADLGAVVVAIHTEGAQLALAVVEHAAAEVTGDPLERLRVCVRAFLALVAINEDLARVFFVEIRALGPEQERRHEQVLQRITELLLDGVRQGVAQGVISRAPDELTAFALVAGLEAVAMRYVRSGEGQRALEAEDVMVELIVRAFR